jgi:hypothetical protein
MIWRGRIQTCDDALYTREVLKKIVKETKQEVVAVEIELHRPVFLLEFSVFLLCT